jgi:2-polyprenyl-6-methoxyphenol hydroxylase-like FAD-dependent oxidoreductase
MTDAVEASVAIVGAGPVGMTLAMQLAVRGVDVVLIERRQHAEPPSVKCNHISARSMEIFRQLGVADALRGSGLPADHPHDCAYRLSVVGEELARTVIPSRSRRRTGEGVDSWWPAAELPHRINQIYTEPILTHHLSAMNDATILNRHEVVELEQETDSVRLSVVNLDDAEPFTLTARFVVGCDGPRSTVRKLLDVKLDGPPISGRVQSTLIRAPQLMEITRHEPAWCVSAWNPRRTGVMFAIDGVEQFLVHTPLRPGEEYETVDRDRSIRAILGVGPDFEYEVLSIEDYEGRGLVASAFRDRRVFLAGDAAHLWMPFAGYGMNAGIADAQDLGWLLAANLQGWAPERALDAYEQERRPVTGQVARHAMGFLPELIALSSQVPEQIEDPGAQGDAIRADFGRRAYALNTPQYACAGLNFGYYYDDSPLIAYDGQPAPGYTMGDFTTSTVPGCRAPHVWLEDGSSLYDSLGRGYAVIRRDPQLDLSGLQAAASERGMPFRCLDLTDVSGADAYDHGLVIVRPDQHVAWRGDDTPQQPGELLDLLRGARSPVTA